MKNGLRALILCAFTIICLVFTTSQTTLAQELSFEETGKIDGAPYSIKVPANWNGKLLIFAHGYGRVSDAFNPVLTPIAPLNPDLNQQPPADPFEAILLNMGYALAASSYKTQGWAVKDGVIDTNSLKKYFEEKVSKPTRTILWGRSMGTAVTIKSAEIIHNQYDGAILFSHVGAGSTANHDLVLAIAVAYEALFGWPAHWVL